MHDLVARHTPIDHRPPLLLVAAFAVTAACATHRELAEPIQGDTSVVITTPSDSTTWTVELLERLEPVDVTWSHHEAPHTFRGVALSRLTGAELAQRSSVDPSKSTWASVVCATSRDGECAVFSAGELRGSWGPTRAYLVWRQDGAPLPEADGPLRLVVPTNGGGSRCARQVETIRIVDWAALAPDAASSATP